MISYDILPKKIEFHPFANSDWKMPESQPQLQPLMTDLRAYLDHKFYLWDKDQEFTFMFPPSAFTQMDRPLITYHQPGSLDDNQEVRPLSQKQLSQIKQEGTFFVESNFYPIPYKWKLNTWIYKGYVNRIETFYKDLALVFSQLYELPNRIRSDRLSLKKGAIRIVKFIPNLLNIIIGIRKVHDKLPDYVLMIQKIRSIQSFKVCNRTKLYEYFYVPLLPQNDYPPEVYTKWSKINNEYNARLAKLKQIDSEFHRIWNDEKKIVIKRLKEKHSDDKTINLKYKQEMNRVRSFVIKDALKEIPSFIVDDLFYFIISYEIIKNNSRRVSNDLQDSKKQFEQHIGLNYKIKKYCQNWRYNQIEKFRHKEQKRLQEKMINETQQELKDPVFNKYCQLIPDDVLLEDIKKDNPPQKCSNRNFECTYKLFPPYQIESIPSVEGIRYNLIKEKNIVVSTNHAGWKVVLYFIRWYTWTRNVMYWLFRGLWGGRLGLKVLFYTKPFNPRYCVNHITGELGRSKEIQWRPIVYQFCWTWSDIDKDRREFEQAPDNGFFGKTCSRMCSIFYNYVIRLVFFMIFWLLLLKPLIIILNVIMLTVISTTAILWIPIALITYGIFNMLIYNFDLDQQYARISERFFPLILSSLKLVYDILYSLLAIFGAVLFHPLLAFILVLWSLLRISFKTILDFFMLGFIKCCARSPVRDTKIAWRVSGPGLSRDYYQTIRQQDIYVLFLAEIERYHLQYVKDKYLKDIRQVQQYPTFLVNCILKPFNLSYNIYNFGELQNSVNFYINKIQTQYARELQKFPNKPGNNIRFNQIQLEKYLGKSHEILMNYIKKQGADFLFSLFNVDPEQGTEQLVYKLWISVFGNQQIFEPFEDLDHRFELINDRQDDAIKSVLKSISGDPEYKQKIVSLKFLNRAKIDESPNFVLATQMLDSMTRYRQRQYGDSRSNVWQGLFFNFNTKDEANKQDSRFFELSMEGLEDRHIN